MFKNDEYRN